MPTFKFCTFSQRKGLTTKLHLLLFAKAKAQVGRALWQHFLLLNSTIWATIRWIHAMSGLEDSQWMVILLNNSISNDEKMMTKLKLIHEDKNCDEM